MSAIHERTSHFFFERQSDQWLGVLRIGIATEVLLYCVSLRRDWNYFLSGHGGGLINRQVSEILLSSQSDLVPRMSWFVDVGHHLGLSESTVLFLTWLVLLDAALLLLFGLFSRGAAIVTWLLHLASVKSGGVLSYGVDNFTTIGLFYLMFAPLPDRWSIDHRSRNIALKDRQLHGFFRRVLQLHLCLIYFFGGLAKGLGIGWWTGESIWRALVHPPFNVIPSEILVRWRILFPIMSVATVLLEVAYPFFIWPRSTRRAWLIGIFAMHLGIGLGMGMYLFALVMIILNLAAFGSGVLWRDEDAPDSYRSAPAQAELSNN
jgi:Vitamin K-dependent gamma-carboxylase